MPIFTSHISGSQIQTNASGVSITGSFEMKGGMVMNSNSIPVNTVVPSNYNALLYGPITIESGVTITIESNGNLKIKDISDA
tara:strand:- start:1240 stop:1485 length:246 start_codon:yes stop_codon:yes gene_type:complete